jgi:hypothetical protein
VNHPAAVALPPDELVRVLRRTGGNVARTAIALGVNIKALRWAIAKAGISAKRVRDFEPDPFVPRKPGPGRGRARASRRPLVRRLGIEACDVTRPRHPLGTGTGSGCALGVRGELATFEVTERLIRNIAVDMPVVTINLLREHWASRMTRRKKIRRVIAEALGEQWKPPALPEGWYWLVTLTRYAHLRLDDDNCTSSFKTHRDACAELLGLSDRDKRVSFRCFQAKWSEKTTVKRWNRVTKRNELKPGYRCFFRVRIEQVKDGA